MDHYQAQADFCRYMATECDTEADLTFWHGLAAKWQVLADEKAPDSIQSPAGRCELRRLSVVRFSKA